MQQFDKFWMWRSICKTRTTEIWQKDTLTLDGLEKGQLIQLDDVTRIKLAFRNQGQLAPFVCYLVFKIGNFAIDITEQKKFLSNCSKQLVTPVNLTRKFFLRNYLISRIGSELQKLKTAFYESHFPHCVIAEVVYGRPLIAEQCAKSHFRSLNRCSDLNLCAHSQNQSRSCS